MALLLLCFFNICVSAGKHHCPSIALTIVANLEPWLRTPLSIIQRSPTTFVLSRQQVRRTRQSCKRKLTNINLVGRDKLLRALQYFSRFYAWYLYRTNNPARLIAPFEAIKKHFGLTRKALRLGKNVEHFKAAAVAADSKDMDPVLKYCTVGRQLGYAMYLSLDAVTYVCA